MAYSGRYQLQNPHKYVGDRKNIIWRSTYELKLFKYCDHRDHVLKWSSEEVVIPYINPLDNRKHRYFVDVYMQYRKSDGTTQDLLIEVKPKVQKLPPKKRRRKTKQYIMEVERWAVNQAKWAAAEKWAAKRNMQFRVFTETELGIH